MSSKDQTAYKKLFNYAIDMLCIAGTEGYLKDVNPAFTKMLGFSREKILATPFMDMIHPDDHKSTYKALEQLQSGEPLVNFENRYRCADGSYRIISWVAHPEWDDGDIFCVAKDVTEERSALNELNQLKNALNDKTILAKTDRAGNIVEVNDRFCEISGYSREELIGQNHRLINSGKHPKAFFDDLWATISSGKIWSGLIENKRKNGAFYFVYSIIFPLTDIMGKITGYQSVRYDATKQMEDKAKFEKTLAILDETSKIAKVGGWELDIASGELFWTDETFKILEVERKDGQKPLLPEGLDLFTPSSKPIIERAVQRCIEFGEPYSLELEALTAKGNVLWVYTNGKANYENGKIVSLSGTIQDIHEKKVAENKLKKSEADLKIALKNATAANQSKSEFVASMSHELRTPLNAILGFSDILKSDESEKIASERFKEYGQHIFDSGTYLLDLVNDILDLSAMEAGNMPLHKEAFDLKILVADAISILQEKAKTKGIFLSTTYETQNTEITADKRAIKQILLNIVNNAVKFTDRGGEVSITVSAEDGICAIAVKDTGRGMSKERIAEIGSPFVRSSSDPHIAEPGWGLGLAISKSLIDLHEGTLEIDSELGAGSRITIKLPQK